MRTLPRSYCIFLTFVLMLSYAHTAGADNEHDAYVQTNLDDSSVSGAEESLIDITELLPVLERIKSLAEDEDHVARFDNFYSSSNDQKDVLRKAQVYPQEALELVESSINLLDKHYDKMADAADLDSIVTTLGDYWSCLRDIHDTQDSIRGVRRPFAHQLPHQQSVKKSSFDKIFLNDLKVRRNAKVGGNGQIEGCLAVKGDTELGGELTVSKEALFEKDVTLAHGADLHAGGDLSVKGVTSLNTLKVEGSELIEGKLIVDNNAIFKDDVKIEGGLTIRGALNLSTIGNVTFNDLTISHLTTHDSKIIGDETVIGNESVSGKLSVGQGAVFNDNVLVKGDCTVKGATSLDTLAAGTTKLGSTTIQGSETVTGRLSVYDKAIFTDDVVLGTRASTTTVSGDLNTEAIHASGSVHVGGNVHVGNAVRTQSLTASGDVLVEGDASFKKNVVLGSYGSTVKVNGTLDIPALHVSGDESVDGTLDVAGMTHLASMVTEGDATFQGMVKLGGCGKQVTICSPLSTQDLKVDGDATVHDILTVDGDTRLASLTASGDTALQGNVILGSCGSSVKVTGAFDTSMLRVSGNESVDGTLDVAGATRLASILAEGDATLRGTVRLGGCGKQVTVCGPLFTQELNVTGDAIVQDTLTVDGDTKLTSLIVSTDTTLQGNVILGSADSGVKVTGVFDASTLHVSGNELVAGNLDVAGATRLASVLAEDVIVDTLSAGITKLGSTTIQGSETVTGRLSVYDKAIFTDDVVLGTRASTTTVSGDLNTEAIHASGSVHVDGNVQVDSAIRAQSLTVSEDVLAEGDALFKKNVILGDCGSMVKVNGVLDTSELHVHGSEVVDGDLDVAGTTRLASILAEGDATLRGTVKLGDCGNEVTVCGSLSTGDLKVDGDATVHDVLTVDGDTRLASLTAGGDTALQGNVILGSCGSTVKVNGSLEASELYVYGSEVVDGDLDVAGTTRLASILAEGDATLRGTVKLGDCGNEVTVCGSLSTGDLKVDGDATVHDVLTVDGDTRLASLTAGGDTALQGNVILGSCGSTVKVNGSLEASELYVYGSEVVDGDLDVAGTTRLASILAEGDATLRGTVKLGDCGNEVTVCGLLSTRDLKVDGDATVHDVLTVDGDTRLASLTANGDTALRGNVILGDCGSTVKVNGVLEASALHVSGNELVTGNLDVAGTTRLAGVLAEGDATLRGTVILGDCGNEVTVCGPLSTWSLKVDGDATVHDVLTVDGDTRLASLSASGDTALRGNVVLGSCGTKITICGELDIPLPHKEEDHCGNEKVCGNLDVRGDVTIGCSTGPCSSRDCCVCPSPIPGGLTVCGPTNLKGDVSIGCPYGTGTLTVCDSTLFNGPVSFTQCITGPLCVNGDFTVNGNEVVNGNLTVTGDQIIDGDLTVKGTINGEVTLPDTVTIGCQTGEGSLIVCGTATFTDTVNFEGPIVFSGSPEFDECITGPVCVNGDVTVNGDEVVNGDLTVRGMADFQDNVSIGCPYGTGNLTVCGSSLFSGAVTFADSVTFEQCITGPLCVNGTFTVNGNETVNGNLTVTGTSTFDGAVTFADSVTFEQCITGPLCVNGTFTVNGNETVNGNLTVTGTIFQGTNSVVVGTTTSNNDAIARFSGTTGEAIKNSAMILTDLITTPQPYVALQADDLVTPNISFVVEPKGTGALIATISTGIFGNARGINAVDLQLNRPAATDVAGGDFSTVSGGSGNAITGPITANIAETTISGGSGNTISVLDTSTAVEATIGGGSGNSIMSITAGVTNNATIAGGIGNTISGNGSTGTSGFNATIGGGFGNAASAQGVVIAGGEANAASGITSTIGGGTGNSITGPITANIADTTISGGIGNTISILDTSTAVEATIGGGSSNSITSTTAGVANNATIAGGSGNTISGNGSTGTSGLNATIGGGLSNAVSAQGVVIAGGESNGAGGTDSTIGGGTRNSISGVATSIAATTIGGGSANSISTSDTSTAIQATIGGGSGNSITVINAGVADNATIAGGSTNVISINAVIGPNATIGGGLSNLAEAEGTVIAGGENNSAERPFATVGGGSGNTVSGEYSTIPGGINNSASGTASFAAGNMAQAVNNGAFVWADDLGGGTAFSSTLANQFSARATGGVVFDLGGAAGTPTAGTFLIEGALTVTGAKAFDIPHPSKPGMRLRHSCVESPTAGDNIYRFTVEVVDGKAELELPDYFPYLNGNIQAWANPASVFGFAQAIYDATSNEIRVIGSADGVYNILVIGTRIDALAQQAWAATGVEYTHQQVS